MNALIGLENLGRGVEIGERGNLFSASATNMHILIERYCFLPSYPPFVLLILNRCYMIGFVAECVRVKKKWNMGT